MSGTNETGRSLPDVIKDIGNDLNRLVRDEVALARTETQDKVNQVTTALISIIAGGLLGFVALIVLLFALVTALENVMPEWLAAVIVGGVVAIIGFVLVKKGQSDLKVDNLAPNRTIKNVERDADVAKEQAR